MISLLQGLGQHAPPRYEKLASIIGRPAHYDFLGGWGTGFRPKNLTCSLQRSACFPTTACCAEVREAAATVAGPMHYVFLGGWRTGTRLKDLTCSLQRSACYRALYCMLRGDARSGFNGSRPSSQWFPGGLEDKDDATRPHPLTAAIGVLSGFALHAPGRYEELASVVARAASQHNWFCWDTCITRRLTDATFLDTRPTAPTVQGLDSLSFPCQRVYLCLGEDAIVCPLS